MNLGFRFKLLSAFTALVLVFSLAAPTIAFANEPTPEEPTPTAEETAPAEVDVAEVVEAMVEAEVVLLDPEGEVIPLASEEALNALTAPDPIGCPPGVTPAIPPWNGTGVGCTTSYTSIQEAIDDVSVDTGWTIYIEGGTFYENVKVTKSVTLQGSGQGVTIVKPANNDAGTCAGSCPSLTNTVIWVYANGVSIYDLTVDGDNELLGGGESVGGADINAHNGIVANEHTGLTVENVTVQNVYARGIQEGLNGGTFDIRNNTVTNVQGDYYSFGIFGYQSGGVIDGNTISGVGDGIGLNWSTGTQVTNNTVTNASSGIHTDNAQGADVIDGNTITNGKSNSYGIFVFAPYNGITVSNNDIENVDYGLTLAGNGFGDELNQIVFDNNEVDANVAGGYITTDVWGYFKSNVNTLFSNNTISGAYYGFYLESQAEADYVPGYYGADDCTGDCVLQLTLVCNTVSGDIFYATGLGFWNGDVTPNYNGVYIVDDSGNVCVVDDGGEDEPSPAATTTTTTTTTTSAFIPVTGGNTRMLNLSDAGVQTLLEQVAAPQFPLAAEDGLFSFLCMLESVTTLSPEDWISADGRVVTSVGQCSYAAADGQRTVTLALSFEDEAGSYDPGDLLQVSLAEDAFADFAESGEPFDLDNFLVATSLELVGQTGTQELKQADLLAAMGTAANASFPLAEQDGEFSLACVLESVTVLDEGIAQEDGREATSVGLCSYLVSGVRYFVPLALAFDGGASQFAAGDVLALGLAGDAVTSFAGSGNPDDLAGLLEPASAEKTGSVN